MVVIGLHGRDQLLVQVVQQLVQVHLRQIALLFQGGRRQLRGAVAGAAGHAQQAAVDLVRASGHRRQGVGLGEPQVAVAVEAHRDGDLLLQGGDVGRRVLGEHGAGGVHDGDLVHARVLEHLGLLRQLCRCGDVGLHQGVAAGEIGLFHQLHRLHGAGAVAGVGTYPQEAEAAVLGHANHVLICHGGHHEHTQPPLGLIGLQELQILLITEGLGGTQLLVGTDALAVAQLNIFDARRQQALDDADRQVRGKPVADDVSSVPEGIVKQVHIRSPLNSKSDGVKTGGMRWCSRPR